MEKGWNYGGKNEYEDTLAKMLVDQCDNIDTANLMTLGAALNFTGRTKVRLFFFFFS